MLTQSACALPAHQRHLTEKENQRVTKKVDAIRRKVEKVKKAEKAERRAWLHQQEANGEEVNEDEIEQSDVDDVEDYMFTDCTVTTKLSAKKDLPYRADRLPLAATTNKGCRNTDETPPLVVPSGDDRDDDDEPVVIRRHVPKANVTRIMIEDNVDAVTITLSAFKKCRRDDDNDNGSDGKRDGPMQPKYQKGSDRSSHPRAKDFDDATQEVLTIAIAIFRCMVSMKASFPDTSTFEIEMVQQAWKKACEQTGLNVIVMTTLIKMITKRTSHVRGELKTKVCGIIQSFYDFRSGKNKSTISRNCQHTEDLKDGYSFVYEDSATKKGLYKSEIIQMVINDMWFANKHDEGVRYHGYFNPMPVVTIALVLTAVECGIDEWAAGIKEDVPFTAASYKEVYQAHLHCLHDFEKHTINYGILRKRCNLWHGNARFHSGAELISKTTVPALDVSAFEAAIREWEESETDDSDNEAVSGMEGA
ncbi:hypothetical protein SCP_1900320 [Sparassis crispa]|uniref:DUF6532 domain-containing protein n=1 Tax=Sparassis crispa TaxID=139825 RepID=A0A401H723_9APHY|nr:hypothetical protein SCP_1900320 [Sparassis crispa]GBE90183.1 hypothetical protein SCP_1900320 [Sparassis crispa]